MLEQGAYGEVIAELEKGMVVAGIDATAQARLAYAFARAGNCNASGAAAAATHRIGTPGSLDRALFAKVGLPTVAFNAAALTHCPLRSSIDRASRPGVHAPPKADE